MLLCRHITGSGSILVSTPAFHMPIHFIGTGINMPVTLQCPLLSQNAVTTLDTIAVLDMDATQDDVFAVVAKDVVRCVFDMGMRQKHYCHILSVNTPIIYRGNAMHKNRSTAFCPDTTALFSLTDRREEARPSPSPAAQKSLLTAILACSLMRPSKQHPCNARYADRGIIPRTLSYIYEKVPRAFGVLSNTPSCSAIRKWLVCDIVIL